MEIVQPAVERPTSQITVGLSSVIPQSTHLCKHVWIVRRHRSRVAEGTEQLRWVETETPCQAPGSSLSTILRRAKRLGGILDDQESATGRNRHDLFHITQAAVEMHWHDGFGAWSDRRLDPIRVEIVVSADIHQHRRGAGMMDCCCR